MDQNIVMIALFLLGGLCTVMWWLLRNKDAVQAEHIKELFKKHEEDAEKLAKLELEIARQYYVKTELDPKFDEMKKDIKDGFDKLGVKFDNLGNALTEHIRKEDAK